VKCVDVSTVRRWVRRFKDGELGQAALKTKHQLKISKTSAALPAVY